MEHAPQPQHREGIQNELDKAYAEAHEDNKEMKESEAKTAEKSSVSHELAETIARLRDAGYLDSSFEGKEVYPLVVRALSEEEAVEEYKKSGNKFVYDGMKMSDLYEKPKEETLNVMIMTFSDTDDEEDDMGSRDVIGVMDNLGVSPVTYA